MDRHKIILQKRLSLDILISMIVYTFDIVGWDPPFPLLLLWLASSKWPNW